VRLNRTKTGPLVAMAAFGKAEWAAEDPPDEQQADLQHRAREIAIPVAGYPRISHLSLSINQQLLAEPGRHRIAVGLVDRLTWQASYHVHSGSTPDASEGE
jgi:hypothetical protein